MTEDSANSPPSPSRPKPRALLELFPPVRAAAAGPQPSPRQPTPPQEPLTYEPFYGFLRNPFNARPDLQWLFRTAAFERALDEVRNGLAEHRGAIVVTGPRGIGKTMLCLAVEAEIGASTPTSVVTDRPQSPEALLDTLLADFSAGPRDAASPTHSAAAHADSIRAFRSLLMTFQSLGESAAIVVDDADELPTSVLQQIGELCGFDESATTLRVVLVGKPALRARLAQPELRALAAHLGVTTTLEPFTLDEMNGYVAHRLAAAGPTPRVEFDERALRTAYEITAGVPAAVNAVCDGALLCGAERSASVIDRACVVTAAEDLELIDPPPASVMPTAIGISVVLALFALGGAFGAAWVFRDRVANGVALWEAVPPTPAPPALRQPVPLSAIPPP